MSKQNTIEGTVFKCQCGKRFIAGPAGLDKLDERVFEHMKETGHLRLSPINPKPGMVFVLDRDKTSVVGSPFAGDDVEEWNATIQREAMAAGDGARPAWELATE